MNWISVKDRMPDFYQEVIIYSPDEGVQSGVYYSTNFGFEYADWSNRSIIVNVTYWMPLPEPPSYAK